MVDTAGKTFRHPDAGRLYPGEPFSANDISYPANWLECATERDLADHNISVSTGEVMTEADVIQAMDKYHRQELRDLTTAQQFEHLGRFVQAFELMVHAVRSGCVLANSITPQQQMLINIAFHHDSMGAHALFSVFRATVMQSLYGDNTTQEDPDRKAAVASLKHIATRYDAMCKKRNSLLHGTWFIGYGNAAVEITDEITMHKGKVSATGVDFDHPVKSVGELKLLIQECKAIEEMLQKVTSVLLLRTRCNEPKKFPEFDIHK